MPTYPVINRRLAKEQKSSDDDHEWSIVKWK